MYRRLAVAIAATALGLSACTGAEQPEEPAEETPAADTELADVTEQLTALPTVDIDDVDPPQAPGGVDPTVRRANVETVRELIDTSFDERWWTEEPARRLAVEAWAPAPPSIATSFFENDAYDGDLPISGQLLDHFSADAQPVEPPRIVAAAWTEQPNTVGEGPLSMPTLMVTSLYLLAGPDEPRPVLVTRSRSLATANVTEPVSPFAWQINSERVGNDECEFYTDGVITPGEDPADDLRKALAAIDAGEPLADNFEESNVSLEEQRAEACADPS